MDEFGRRQEAFERRFALDEDLRFRTLARRNRLIGEWAAALLGKTAGEASIYARELINTQVGRSDDELTATLKADFAAAGVAQSDHRIDRALAEMLERAKGEIARGA